MSFLFVETTEDPEAPIPVPVPTVGDSGQQNKPSEGSGSAGQIGNTGASKSEDCKCYQQLSSHPLTL